MLNRDFILNYLKDSLLLDDSESKLKNDPAFDYNEERLWGVLQIAAVAHNPNYTLNTFPEEELEFLILKAKIELYYRMATATAPFYPLEAEGASLRKDVRFNHYMSLVRLTRDIYESAWAKFEAGSYKLEAKDCLIRKYHLRNFNYERAEAPKINLNIEVIRDTSIDVSWNKFKAFSGVFDCYALYLSKFPIYDRFENKIDSNAHQVFCSTDIHRNLCRVGELEADSDYFLLGVVKDMNGLIGVHEISFKTVKEWAR